MKYFKWHRKLDGRKKKELESLFDGLRQGFPQNSSHINARNPIGLLLFANFNGCVNEVRTLNVGSINLQPRIQPCLQPYGIDNELRRPTVNSFV